MQSAKRHTIFLTHDGLTDPLGQSQILPYLAGISRGFEVHIISCEKPEKYAQLKGEIESVLAQYNIRWYPVVYKNSPPLISTFFMLREMYVIAKDIHRKFTVSILHCRSYLAAMVGLRLKERLGIKMIFDIRGFWADERVEGGVWNLKNPVYAAVYRYMKHNEKLLFQSADAVVCLTRASSEVVINNFKTPAAKVTVIPCAADLNLFNVDNKIPANAAKSALCLPDSAPVLTYLGSVGTGYMLNEMLDFFKAGQQLLPGLHFLFVSPKESHTEILAAAKAAGIDENKILLRFSPRKKLPELLSAVDYSVFFYKPSFSRKATSPTKHGELTALHIPCVTNAGVGDMPEILHEEQIGAVIDTFELASYQTAWKQLITLKPSAEAFDRTAQKYYSLETGIKTYLGIYRRLI